MQKSRLLIVTAVWGDWHVSSFLDINLPTLLADGNFPSLAAQCELSYVIYTGSADARRVRLAPEVAALSRLMAVKFRTVDDRMLRNPIEAHHVYWAEACGIATRSSSAVLLMPPDVAWSDGSFRHVGRLLSAGKRAIFMTYLRVESEAFSKAFLARRPVEGNTCALSGSELVELSVRTLHPLMAAYSRNSRNFPIHPEMMIWPVHGEGLHCRMLAREMFIYHPADVELTENRLAATNIDLDAMEIVRDSDDLFAVSLAPFEKESQWYEELRSAAEGDIGDWWLDYDSWINDFVVGAKLRWHFTPVSESAWRAREQGADVFLRRAAAAREGRRMWRTARTLGCALAARLIAVATQSGLMARVLRGRGGAIVFLPSDDALTALGEKEIDRLQGVDGAQDLVRLMRRHFVPNREPAQAQPLASGADAPAQQDLAAADGSHLAVAQRAESLQVNGFQVAAGPLHSGGNQVYVIDGVIASQPGPERRPVEPLESVEP